MNNLIINLMLASAMMAMTVVMHFIGIILLLRLVSTNSHHVAHLSAVMRQSVLLVAIVLGIVFLHTLEIWAYALFYLWLGALEGLEPALYFSTVTFVTLGYGDIVLPPQWRLLSGIEAANGILLFGWSTAFLIAIMGKMRALEHDWLEK